MSEPDPKDYLAMLALGVGALGQPHVWETPRRSAVSGALVWSCKFCDESYTEDKANEPCPKHPSGVAHPGRSG